MKRKRFFPEDLGFVAIAILCVTAIFLGLRQVGKWQYWELLAFDQMLKWRRDLPQDERLLVVAITEEDIRRQQQWPVSDQVLAQVLKNIQKYQPQSIGLDIYRDIPVNPGHEQLKQELKKPNLFVVRNIDTIIGTPAPPSSSPEQIGFNDIPLDPDGVVRRNVLFAETEKGETLPSFSLLIAFNYLQNQQITPQGSEKNPDYLQLGQAVFEPLTQKSGGYQKIDAGGYQVLLNYRNRNNPAKTITFSQVLEGKFDPKLVKDRIVLIGTTAISLRDTFFTPYNKSGKNIPGVMLHGHLLSQLLDAATGKRPLFWYWTEKQEIFWLIFWIVVGGITGFLFRHPIAVFLAISGGVIIILTTGMILFLNGGWIPITTPVMGFIFTIGMVVTHQSYQDYQKQQTVMKLLGQNTSPEIATALWEQRDNLLTSGKLPGVSLTATLLFLDIKGFSTISEIMTPKNLLNWLNQSLEKMASEIVSYKGVINKFTGDGLMAVFGVPIPRKNRQEIAQDAQNCVNCALAIGEYLDSLNLKCQRDNLPLMQMRIGIYTGEVVAGSLGGKDRIEYGVIGDTVNTASRLESCDKDNQPSDCRILIGKETLAYLDDKFIVESWGEKELKGKKQMVSVYRVIGKKIDN
jgi:adenylate cyclase